MARKNSGLRFQPSGGSKAPQVPVGKKLKLQIERQANDGRGIGFNEGRTWFVSGALTGEQVEARVLSARGKIVEARTERVLTASEQRRAEACVHARVCGGCSLQHMPHVDQVALKQSMLAEQLTRLADIQPMQWAAPLAGPELGYRRRARIAVRWDNAARHLAVGFRAAASQDIIDIDQCPVLVQPLQPILQALPDVLRGLEKPQAIGHVELFSGDSTAVLVRHTATLSEADLEHLHGFCLQQKAQLWLQGKDEPQPYVADQQLNYRLEQYNLALAYRPGDFVQVNQPVNDLMIAQALDWLAPQAHERLLDLFCGLGNFALPLAQRVRELVAVEGVDAMVQRAAQNAKTNGLNNAHFYQADLSNPLDKADWAKGGFDAVLLDPPRDGALQVVQQIGSLGAQRVLYVSCNPATLARDSAELRAQGYRLERAGILDMFPQTAHVEAMALFVRQ
ncbi:23S rRNA (uracil(1939)-C(5))-methyltransferase RlmD [Pseudomonas sp. TTU2014-080ASC]|uniref:23S rRNA (uracil(1939)-C(5))-methyltransferase RlmD n=1 Tax=Pseudomonas sp. TTU2014-080ASC TaxID=1729724 RepID=UPI0007183272|nr:23S rRNA (uracil(1939)-C(5))-methyltransferase RlmD [Pseudomonas sp. TTU2014-080ASC]KRW59652.1 23S rRNA methyltransferase [Pseudomonas sp. TTU2014-080ASC]